MQTSKKPYESIFRRLFFGVLCLAAVLVSATFVYGANTAGVLNYATGEVLSPVSSDVLDMLSPGLQAEAEAASAEADAANVVFSDPIPIPPEDIVPAEFSAEPGALPAYAISAEPIDTYSDGEMEIAVTKYSGNEIVYFAADITLSSAKYIKTAFAFGIYEGQARQYTTAIAKSNGAVLAINGDYYNFREDGIILRNGKLYRNIPSDRDVLIIDRNGNFSAMPETTVDVQKLVNTQALQTLSFGPILVKEKSILKPPSNYSLSPTALAPRTAIGQIGPLHYIFVVVDGRQEGYSDGVSLGELGQIMASLGCTVAYNLDGGGSSTMVFQNRLVNRPSNTGEVKERSVSDIVYIG